MTVHRAQGQSIDFLEVDYFPYFAPGQMGVALGRTRTTDGLCVVNCKPTAARLKHPQEVYDFYGVESTRPTDDLKCCKNIYVEVQND
jgi:hypothetical protein